MRLQLDQERTATLASECGRAAGSDPEDIEADVRKVLQAFTRVRHSPFTRKDVAVVLGAMGAPYINPGKPTVKSTKASNTIVRTIQRETTKGPGRGYYTLDLPKEYPPAEPERHSSVRGDYRPTSNRDDRDSVTWVVFELTASGESYASEGYLEEHLRQVLDAPGHEVFVTYLSYVYDGRAALFNAMEGYAFAASGLDERIYLNAVHSSPYIRGVLHYSGGTTTVLQTVPDSSVRELRERLAEMVAVEIEEGMRVEITRGICQGLQGRVVGLTETEAYVLVTLRTLHTIRTIPRFALLPVGDTS